ncbi:MAG: tight adherence protein C [Actinomycetes bacterium]|jgi:tight adherence protein C
MSPTALLAISTLCVVLAIVFAVVALKMKDGNEGRELLKAITTEVGRKGVVDHHSSFRQRLLDPSLVKLTRLGWKLTPAERVRALEERVEAAGYPAGWDVNRLILIKVLNMFVGAALGLLIALTLNLGFGLVLMFVLGVGAFFLPDYILSKVAARRTDEMRRTLADTVDMLNLTLAAGISFDSALKLVAQNTDGPLAQEFGRVVQEITIGKSRSQAMIALADRTQDDDLRRFATTCVQAERRGTPFGEILRIQSKELRIKRRQIAEEKAQKVPVKILFPMMIFVLPVLMLVVLGPAVIQIMEGGLGGGGG